MKAIELAPPAHLAAEDLTGDTLVTIESAFMTKVGEKREDKGAVKFKEFSRAMVINRTNVKRLIDLLGGETDAWVGKQITIYPSETDFAGKTVPCLRVKVPKV